MKRKVSSKTVIFNIVVMLCIMLFGTSVYANEDDKDVDNKEFYVTTEIGLDGIAVEYKATPVSVTVKNMGADFEGVLRVVIPATYEQKSLAYEKSVTVPSGGEKTFSMLLPDIKNTAYLRIELENTRGKIVYSAREKYVSSVAGKEAIVGVLSSDYTGLNYFDGVTISTSSGVVTAKLLQLTADNLPEVGDGLDTCNYIIIDNYNTSQLSDKQRMAIVSWVNNGGILIFGTGSKASVVLEGFTDTLVPVTVDGLIKSTMTVYANDTYSVDNVDLVQLSNTENWADIESSIASGAPVWQQSYGGGNVVILSYDLAMNPIVGWKVGRGALAENILSNSGSNEQYIQIINGDAERYDEYDIDSITVEVDQNKIPNAFLYGFIFLVYVVGIGPVAYLILRAMDKREKLWIVMPCVTLGFTVIILLTSMIYKIHKPFVDEFSIVEFNNGLKSTKSYMSIQSPKGREYEVDLTEAYQQIATWNQDVDYSQIGTTDYEYTIVDKGDHLVLRMAQTMAFTRQNLMAEKQEYTENDGFVMELNCSLNGIEGEVTNETGYDLTNVVICYHDRYVFLDAMKNGETKKVDENLNYYVSSLSWDMSNWMAETPDSFSDFHRLFGESDDYRKLQLNQSIYRMIRDNVHDLEIYQGMVFGVIDDYDPEIVDDSKAKVYSSGLAVAYYQQLPVEYAAYSMFVDDINDCMVGGDYIVYSAAYPQGYEYFYDIDDRDMYGQEEMEVLYDFSGLNLDGAFLRNNDFLDLEALEEEYADEILDPADFDSYMDYLMYITEIYTGTETNYADVLLYNYETEQYEEVFTDGNEFYNLTPYVDENGWMRVKYSNPFASDPDNYYYYECYGPHISLIGGEQ